MATREDFQFKQVSYQHKNISKADNAPEWYQQLDGSARLIKGSYQKSNTTCFIYNYNQKTDEQKSFSCIKITSPCLIQFNGLDVVNYDVYIKFYSVVTNWANNNLSGPRLVYATIGDCMRQHQYHHPEAVLLDSNGIGVFPVGDYGFRGWEIVCINKEEIDIQSAYQITQQNVTSSFFKDTTLRQPTENINNNLTIVKENSYKNISIPNLAVYSFPCFGYKGKMIKGVGFYTKAIKEQPAQFFTTKEKVAPFSSNKPDKFNYTLEPELLYNDIVLNNSAYKDISFKIQDKILYINSNSYELNDDDVVCIYQFKAIWNKTKYYLYNLQNGTVSYRDKWIPGASYLTTKNYYTDGVVYFETGKGSDKRCTVHIENNDAVLEDILTPKQNIKIFSTNNKTNVNLTLTNNSDFTKTGFTDVSNNALYQSIYQIKDIQYQFSCTHDQFLIKYKSNSIGVYDAFTMGHWTGQETGTPLQPGYTKKVTLKQMPVFYAPNTPQNIINETSRDASIEYGTSSNKWGSYDGYVKITANNVIIPTSYIIYDYCQYTVADHHSGGTYTINTNFEMGLITNYETSKPYFYAIAIFRGGY